MLTLGKNVVAIVATPLQGDLGRRGNRRPNDSPGAVEIVMSSGKWKRSVFNGLAQVIVQSTSQPGEITLRAFGKDLKGTQLKIQTQPATLRPAVP